MLGQKSVVRGLNSERLDGLGKGLVCSGAQYSGGQVSFVLLGRMEATWKLCGRRGDGRLPVLLCILCDLPQLLTLVQDGTL